MHGRWTPSLGQPNTVCLSSRIPYGDTKTQEMLQRVYRAGSTSGARFRQVRVMHFPRGNAVVEVGAPDRVLGHGDEIVGRLRELGFALVALDLRVLKAAR
jgi:PP-loop superfamily ATP-utilizing enzyme